MAGPYNDTQKLLEERPELDTVLETMVALDTNGPWTFDDLDCDSGTFGEIVSREFVESTDDGYRLVDGEATAAALQGDPLETSTIEQDEDNSTDPASSISALISDSDSGIRSVTSRARVTVSQRLRTADTSTPFLFTAFLSLSFLFVMRTIFYRAVFRSEHVVFPGNDPYHYRYFVDQLLTASPGLLEFSAISEALGSRTTGEPLTYVLGWWITRVFEGNPETSGLALAFLPVIATVLVGVLLLWTTLAVTGDERIAVLSVLALAITPGNAVYNGLGFFDHHAIDFLWLAAMIAILVWLARDLKLRGPEAHLRASRTWLATAAFGLVCAGAMMTWNGSPLLLLGVVLYAVVRPASQLRTVGSPLRTSLPLVAGLAVATLVGHLLHTGIGWQERAVVYAPAVVLVGVVGVAGIAKLVEHRDGEPWWVLAGSAAVGIVGLVGLRQFTPELYSRYQSRFLEDLLGRGGIAETKSLLAPELTTSFNGLEHFGVLLLFALPGLGFVTWRCIQKHEPRWLVPVSYGWALFGIALIQVRFAGDFSVIASLFAAVGLIWVLSLLGLSRPLDCFQTRDPVSLRFRNAFRDINKTVYISFVLVVVFAVGIVLTVGVLGSASIDNEQYQSAAWISEDSGDDNGFVLSQWGRNRMYNYFSGSGSSGYGFARSNYAPFLASENPDEWSNDLARVDYLVIDNEQIGGQFPRAAWVNAVGKFQLAFISEPDRITAFRTVRGAEITGEAEPGATVEVSTDIEVSGYEFTYVRETTADDDGEFSVRVAYSGTYNLSDGSTLEVSEPYVSKGLTLYVEIDRSDS